MSIVLIRIQQIQHSLRSSLCAILFQGMLFRDQIFAMARFVLWGTYCAEALEKRAPFRDEHLSRLQSLKEEGSLITLGPTEGSTHVFGIFEAQDLTAVQHLVHEDVYWKQGIWTAVEVYPWIQAF